MEKEPLSDEIINAFVSGELSPEEHQRVVSMMEQDELLRQKINRYQRIRNTIRETYLADAYGVEAMPDYRGEPGSWWLRRGLRTAAAVFVLVGVAMFSSLLTLQFNQPGPESRIAAGKASKADVRRVVVHMNTASIYVQQTLLDETEDLLRRYHRQGKKIQVEIVAYGPGVSFLRVDESQYVKRLTKLKKQYPNLGFAVCGRTLSRLKKLENSEVALLPNVSISRSGIWQILKRQKEGWNYIRI